MDESVDLSKALEKVQDMLSGEDGQNRLQNILGMLTGGQPDDSGSAAEARDEHLPALPSGISSDGMPDMDMFVKLQSIMSLMKNNKNSPQTHFLQALKPFLKTNRQARVEQAVKLINAMKVIKLFKQMNEGGD